MSTIAEARAEVLAMGPLPCCNYLEGEDRECDGLMDPGWPEFRCRSCRAFCGAQAHPLHPLHTTAPENPAHRPTSTEEK